MTTTSKTRYIPEGAEVRDLPALRLTIYTWQAEGVPNGFALLVYRGRRTKPEERGGYYDAGRRAFRVREIIARETKAAEERQRREQAAHGLAVGDVVYSTSGVEQTNVHFFQVVRVASLRSAVVRPIKAETTPRSEYAMEGHTVPKVGEFSGAETMHRACGLHILNGGKHARGDLVRWDGAPRRVSWYA